MNATISTWGGLEHTHFTLPQQTDVYKGKVRDVYTLQNGKLVVVATDRISAFDVILPEAIPYKGQILNQIALHFLQSTEDIIPNWVEGSPHPNVTIGKKAQAIPVEMVIRGYLTGHAWRTYKTGKRILCGVTLPEGMSENDPFPTPIITPATKAEEGHDEDISKEALIERKIVSQREWNQLEAYTRKLYERGCQMAKEQGLILVDTKYEFGKIDNDIILIDEIHTPDSSRYFYAHTYEENQQKGLPQKHLSKEFVREWLIENEFQGQEGQLVPTMTKDIITQITHRYIELFEHITGKPFVPEKLETIEEKITRYLNN